MQQKALAQTSRPCTVHVNCSLQIGVRRGVGHRPMPFPLNTPLVAVSNSTGARCYVIQN